jgi:phosphoglycolate phosphatase
MHFPSISDDIRFILWDWNGTLLDDVSLCLGTINKMLAQRGHPALSVDRYKEIFRFPVREYYVDAGFDFSHEPFDELAVEFIDGYYGRFTDAPLHKDALKALESVKKSGLRQGVLSATEDTILRKTLIDHGVFDYFDEVSGIHNHHADGKLAAGHKLLQRLPFPQHQVLLIGDTLHDAEVAKELGIHCLLVAQGHQSEKRLRSSIINVLPDLEHFILMISNENHSNPPVPGNYA